MVYCGRPSKDCAPCRKKRTKCDLARPSCSQCARTGRACFGYRDILELRVHDHTKDFITPAPLQTSKAHISKPTVVNAAVDDTTASAPPSNNVISTVMRGGVWRLATKSVALSPVPALNVSVHEQATCYFFRNYVLDEAMHSEGFMGYLPHVYNNEVVDSILDDAVIALGLVGIGHTKKSSSALYAAHTRYVKALSGINAKLREPKDAKSDQTLITVMLLGMYEQNTCKSSESMRAWGKHIDGAAALLHLRGQKQLRTRFGLQIFLHLRLHLICNCMQLEIRVPDYVLEWSDFACQFQDPLDQINTRFAHIVLRFANLRAKIKPPYDLNYSQEELLTWILSIDQQCADWADSCPSYGLGRTVRTAGPSESVYSDYYYVYPATSDSSTKKSGNWAQATWNHYNCIRIITHELLYKKHMLLMEDQLSYRKVLQEFSDDEQDHICNAASYIHQYTSDVCACVPYTFNYHKIQDGMLSEDSPPKASGGSLLLWPLFTTATAQVVSDDMRWWVIGRLQKIMEVMGVGQAAALAHVLKLGHRETGTWVSDKDATLEDGHAYMLKI